MNTMNAAPDALYTTPYWPRGQVMPEHGCVGNDSERPAVESRRGMWEGD